MTRQAYLLDVIHGRRGGLLAGALRGALTPLAYVYVAGLKLYLLPYRLGIRKQARLACPVISVGNITTGGTGKTPIAQRICRILVERGLKVCVLSRGYRGANEHAAAVVSTPETVELGPREAGDEAYQLARMLPGVPVLVGKDRRVTGRIACERFHPDAIVLDDGMQFYQLHRDLDIGLIDALNPFDNGWTLPRGLLREPPSHLRRSGCVLITNADRAGADAVGALQDRVKKLAPKARMLVAQNQAERLRALDGSDGRQPDWLFGRSVATLCALGNPASFEAQVERLGALIVHRSRFPDHHEATMGELQEVIEAARAAGAEAVIVSEKDAVKLPPLGRPLPFYVLDVRTVANDESALVTVILSALGEHPLRRGRA